VDHTANCPLLRVSAKKTPAKERHARQDGGTTDYLSRFFHDDKMTVTKHADDHRHEKTL
jgi:hypothetical protein